MKVQIKEKDIRHRRLQMRFGGTEIAKDLQPLQRRTQDRFHAACQAAGNHRFILHHDHVHLLSPGISISVNQPPRLETPCCSRQSSPNASASRARSVEHTSELQSLMRTSYAVFCLKKKKKQPHKTTN